MHIKTYSPQNPENLNSNWLKLTILIALFAIAKTSDIQKASNQIPKTENHTNKSTEVIELNSKTFYDYLSYHDYVFVMFYASWCPHSKQFKPAYDELSIEFTKDNLDTNKNVHFVKIDGDQHQGIASAFKIENFPSFKFIIKGAIKEYTASINRLTIAKWINAV